MNKNRRKTKIALEKHDSTLRQVKKRKRIKDMQNVFVNNRRKET